MTKDSVCDCLIFKSIHFTFDTVVTPIISEYLDFCNYKTYS